MYETSHEFREAAERNGALHHLRGKITLTSGEVIWFGDWLDRTTREIVGTPNYSRQCTSGAEEFGIGQLYTGTASVSIELSDRKMAELRGGELTMEFGVEGQPQWIPLGVWTVTKPVRTSANRVTITAADNTAKLDVPISDPYVGVIDVGGFMNKVTNLTGVEFAQTLEQVEELIGDEMIWAAKYPKTCRAAVSAIAQLMGGFAFANRLGQIEFRKFGSEPVRTIQAKHRHSAALSEYTFGVRGIDCSDQWGRRTVVKLRNKPPVNTESDLIIAENPFIPEYKFSDDEGAERQYRYCLRTVERALNDLPDWTPGEIRYYGDPSLDLGDLIVLEGGINGESRTNFLITSDFWQFRAPQTLISAGAPEQSAGSSGGTGSSQTAMTTINVAKNIELTALPTTTGALTDRFTTVAEGDFACRGETAVFADISAIVTASMETEVRLRIWIDDILQTESTRDTIPAGHSRTVRLTAARVCREGEHRVRVEGMGIAEIGEISAVVWGQNLVGETDDFCQLIDADMKAIIEPETARIYVRRGDESGHSNHPILAIERAFDSLPELRSRVEQLEE